MHYASPETANKCCLAPGTAAAGNKHQNHPRSTTQPPQPECRVMAVTRPLGTMTLIPSVILLLLKEAGAGQPPEGIHKEQVLFLFLPLERVRKAAAACCDQGSSNRARAPFSLEQDNSTSWEGKVTNENLAESFSSPQDPELVNSKCWYLWFCLLDYKAVSGATFSQAKQNLTLRLTLLGMHLPTYQN